MRVVKAGLLLAVLGIAVVALELVIIPTRLLDAALEDRNAN